MVRANIIQVAPMGTLDLPSQGSVKISHLYLYLSRIGHTSSVNEKHLLHEALSVDSGDITEEELS